MKKYLPIILTSMFLVLLGYVVVSKKNATADTEQIIKVIPSNIGEFKKEHSCVRTPEFLKRLNIPQPVMIDLSQKQYKGIALLYGKRMENTLHPKAWEQYEHFSTYALDKYGNIFLAPMPFISIKPTTFNLQKNVYKLDTKTGKIEIFMHFDDVYPSANNPYGITSLVYDCDDETLWVSALDETDYTNQRGVIYQVDIKTKTILSRLEGIDALSLALVKSNTSKYLLVGAARDNALYSYDLVAYKNDKSPTFQSEKLIVLANANEHIRKIKVKGKNHLELQTIPFSYTLIAQSGKEDRIFYNLFWNVEHKKWKVE